MAIPSDDNIIKRKLLIEGESGLDDKRFALLLKDYMHWATSDETSETSDSAYQVILEKICQCENAMEQALLIQLMNMEQSNRYTELLDKIDKCIEKAHVDIVHQRERLKEARVIRKNRQEYHNLANIVKEYPERQESLEKLQKMKTELNNLENVNKIYDEKISLRKKQFHLFLVTLRDLQKLVEQDDPIVDPEDSANVHIEGMDTS